MQLRKLALAIGFTGMFCTNLAQALGLGDITLKSSLNQPLNAEVKLLQASGLSEKEIIAAMATNDAFERVGVEKVFFLNNVDFKVDTRRQVLMLTTRQPVTEPYLNFLVEVQWPAGRLVREYTLLMDIPTFSDRQRTRPVSAPSATTRSAPPKPQPTRAQQTSQNRTPVDSYTVRPGDTLWQIAEQVRPSNSVTIYQTMMGLQRANPDAFLNNNINTLLNNQTLTVPSASEIDQVSHRQAKAQAAEQYNEWKNNTSSPAPIDAGVSDPQTSSSQVTQATGQVTVGGSGSGTDSTAQALAESKEEIDRLQRTADATEADKQMLQDQISKADEIIEKQKREIERLVKLNQSLSGVDSANNEAGSDLAAIDTSSTAASEDFSAQDSISQDDATASTDMVNTASDDVSEVDMPAGDLPTTTVEPEEPFNPIADEATLTSPEYDSAQASDVAASEEAEVVDEKVTEDIAEESEGLMAWVKANLIIVGGMIVALLLLLLAFFKRKKDDDVEEFNFDEASLNMDVDDEVDATEFAGNTEEQALAQSPNEEITEFEPTAIDDEAQTKSETGDPVGEADIYISLGQLDKAQELLNNEIAANPDNIDARLAIMKTYVEQNNVEEFDHQYAQLLTLSDVQASEKARQLRSDFTNAPVFDESIYAVDSIEDNADRDTESMDFDLSEPESRDSDSASDDLSLDLDLDLSDLENIEEADDFDLDNPDLNLTEPEFDEAEFDASLGNNEALDLTSEDLDETDHTVDSLSDELDALNDSGSGDLDSGSLDDALSPLEEQASTEFELDLNELDDVSSVDSVDDTQLEVSDDETQVGFTQETASAPFDDGLDDLEKALDPDGQFDSSENDTFEDDLDLDLNAPPKDIDMASLDEELDAMTSDLDTSAVDVDTSGDDGFEEAVSTTLSAAAMAEDDDLSFLNETDEVATRLGLAKAYIEMGDRDGAEDILHEVLEEGDDEQKAEAQSMLDNL